MDEKSNANAFEDDSVQPMLGIFDAKDDYLVPKGTIKHFHHIVVCSAICGMMIGAGLTLVFFASGFTCRHS